MHNNNSYIIVTILIILCILYVTGTHTTDLFNTHSIVDIK